MSLVLPGDVTTKRSADVPEEAAESAREELTGYPDTEGITASATDTMEDITGLLGTTDTGDIDTTVDPFTEDIADTTEGITGDTGIQDTIVGTTADIEDELIMLSFTC